MEATRPPVPEFDSVGIEPKAGPVVGARVVGSLSGSGQEKSPEGLTAGEKQAIIPLLRAVRPEWFQAAGAQDIPKESSPTP